MKAFVWEGFFNRYVGRFGHQSTGDQRLAELAVMSMDDTPQVGDIYLGRITQSIPSQETYFVDIGWEKLAYLQGRDIARGYRGQKPLAPGDWLLVQIKQEAHGGKGPKVTDKLSLQGRWAVLLTGEHKVMASQKISDALWRRDMLEAIAEEQWLPSLGHRLWMGDMTKALGLILRTEAQGVARDLLYQEVESLAHYLKDLGWQALAGKKGLVPGRCHRAAEDWQASVSQWQALGYPIVTEAAPLLALQLERHLIDLIKRRHPVPGGCELVIDELEALTAVDVNSGAFRDAALSQEAAALAMNLSVLPELCRLIDLRGLSGMLLIDFVNMPLEHQRTLIQAFKVALAARGLGDMDIKGFTKLGILEAARKRQGKSILSMVGSQLTLREERLLSEAFYWDQALLAIEALRWQSEALLIKVSDEAYALWQQHQQQLKAYLLKRCDYLPEVWLMRVGFSRVPLIFETHSSSGVHGNLGAKEGLAFKWL